MTVTISKNGLPVVNEQIDLCASMEDSKNNKDAAEIMTMFGVPDHCPVEATEIKTDESQEYSLEKYKQHLFLAEGKIQVDCKVVHDNVSIFFVIFKAYIIFNINLFIGRKLFQGQHASKKEWWSDWIIIAKQFYFLNSNFIGQSNVK